MKMLIMIGYILGLCRDNGKENGETTGITGLSRGYFGITGYTLGLYKDNGKENGNYYDGLYRGILGNLGVIEGMY